MAHWTEVKESFTDVYELEPYADGFWTKPMGDCAMVVLLWDPHGLNYREGRAQHCKGGLSVAQTEKLLKGLDEEQSVLMVIVMGAAQQPLSFDLDMLKQLQKTAADHNWAIGRYDAKTGYTIVTRSGECRTSDSVKLEDMTRVQRRNSHRCVIL